jgi:hypothetical protein
MVDGCVGASASGSDPSPATPSAGHAPQSDAGSPRI